MSDDIDKHVLKRYEIATKLGKGVQRAPSWPLGGWNIVFKGSLGGGGHRRMA
jgi:hypothetical protein